MSTLPPDPEDPSGEVPETALSPLAAAETEGVRDPAGLYAEQVEVLATALWRSVGEHADMSLQSWLMAEVMIRELTYATSILGISLHQLIREHAYYLWEQAGRQPGRAVEFWLAAEKQVWERLAPPAGPTRPPKPPSGVDPW